MLTLPPTGSVTSGQLLGLSEPWIPVYKKVKSLSSVRLFATPWTVAHQPPLSMGFSSQKYWSGLPRPPPGDLSNPGIEPCSPALAGRFLTI